MAEVPGGALDCKEGGWARRGVLHDASDRDRFVLDVPTGSEWTGEVRCQGDGKPGLLCTLTGPEGAELATLRPPAQAEATPVPLRLLPGRYTIELAATPGRASQTPYLVVLATDADLAALLPAAVTPTTGDRPPAAAYAFGH